MHRSQLNLYPDSSRAIFIFVPSKSREVQSKMQHNVRRWSKRCSAKWDHNCFENNTGNTAYEGAHISSVCYRTTSVLDYLENNTGDTAYEEHMLPLFVTEQLVSGPEKEIHEILIAWYYY
uniref:Uncharacterized protein n=2 Tax=Solanum tuberosum TaxID=4113 RepID=M1BA15_SOLTU